jgi:hypothetical protein
MTSLVFLVEQLATGLYILVAAGVFWYGRKLVMARQAYRATYYELERDIARFQRANAITILILLLEFALVIIGIQRVVAPTIRSTQNIEQRVETVIEDLPFSTPTPFRSENTVIDPSGVNLTPDDLNLRVLATPTLTPTPVGTIVPGAPAARGCDTPDAMLQVPANGMRVFEPITVVGTATSPDFAFFRFEIRGPQTGGSFAILDEKTQPVIEIGEMGQFVPAFYEPGEYQFQVTVFDTTNMLRASCMVNIYISEPIPTPTPLGSGT